MQVKVCERSLDFTSDPPTTQTLIHTFILFQKSVVALLMDRIFPRKVRNRRKRSSRWIISALFVTTFLLPPFQTSKNWEGRYASVASFNGTGMTCNLNETSRLTFDFCQPKKCKKYIHGSSSLSYFFVSASPVEPRSKSDNNKKESKDASSKGKSKDKVECLIDESKGFKNAANIYQCASRQTCCFEYARPSCCGSKPTLQIM